MVTMAQSTSIQVKMKYQGKVKVTTMSKEDMRLSSMDHFKKLIYTHFPDLERLCEDGSARSSFKLEVQIVDDDGDSVSIENDGDLQSVIEWEARSKFVFEVDVKKQAAAARSAKHDWNASASSLLVPRWGESPAGSSKHNWGPSASSSPRSKWGESPAESPRQNWRSSASSSPTSISGETPAKLQGTRGKQPCGYYNLGTGYCKYGSACNFSHEKKDAREHITITARSSSNQRAPAPARRNTNHGLWLQQQYEREANDNITFLSTPDQGFDVLAKIVEQKNLSGNMIELLVKLLSKEGFRLSLMRELTNKVYGLVVGSSFLLQLHGHITTQLRAAKPHEVMPYLLLIEELMFRTTDGWKQVPLDPINNVIQKLEEGNAKTELVTMVNRLIDHRNKLDRQAALSASEPDKNRFLGAEFRSLSIIPSKKELLKPFQSSELPENLVGKKYLSVGSYLETHFRLLREDCVDPLRQGIKAYRSKQTSRELRIYQQVRLVGYRCGDEGVEYVVSFQDSGKINWEGSKRLLYGALLCLSSDGFTNSFIFGVLTGRNFLGKGATRLTVQIRMMDKSEDAGLGPIVHGRTYVMVESTTAYFEAYYHVLKSLQREDMENIPFRKYLLDLEQKVDPPCYLMRRENGDEYDFAQVFPSMKMDIGRSLIHVLQDWPQWPCTLDEAQLEALKHCLTKELSIIQGPPGTGKTFLGLLLVRLLLANFQRPIPKPRSLRPPVRLEGTVPAIEPSNEDSVGRKGPILVICLTNHALDQFLEGIYKFEHNVIRVGARSKSTVLQERTLKKLLDEERYTETSDGQRIIRGRALNRRDNLEEAMDNCIRKSQARYVTKYDLQNIATDTQIRRLFSAGFSYKETVESWLAGDAHPLPADPLQAQCEPFLGYFGNLSLDSEPDNFDEEIFARYNQPRKKERGKVIMLRDFEDEIPVENGWQIQGRTGKNRNHGANGLPDIMDVNAVAAAAVGIDEMEDLPPWPRDVLEALGEPLLRNNDELQQEAKEEMREVDGQEPQLELEGNYVQDGIQHIVDYPDVWSLNTRQRRTLHNYWLDELRMTYRRKLQELTKEYETVCRTAREINSEITLSLLRKANVVGMTTTKAAKFHDILKALNSEILIVEEAAEVLEGHVLSGLSSCIKHLVLIGDHLQLRPSTAVYQLGTKHKLDVSMFERLLRGGVEHVMLQEQRRMRPSFSKLVKSLYPKLKDHESVSKYENIRGVTSDLLFFHHTAEENSTTVDSSKVNTTEAKLVVELTLYLMKQECYSADNIAILTMYTGQLLEIRKLLKVTAESRLSASHFKRMRKMQERIGEAQKDDDDNGYRGGIQEKEDDLGNLLPRVSSVDDFQGEESDIIILSLVRSNDIQTGEGEGTIGFLKTSNRICVALTRAKKGMYIFGNATLLAKRSDLWNKVVTSLRKENALDTKLELVCQNHPDTKAVITKEEDFKQVIDGGCSRPCEWQLECGHVCPRRCHPGSHDFVLCPKPCWRKYSDCTHTCTVVCHGSSDCPPCEVKVRKTFPACGHSQNMNCCTDPVHEICTSPCPKLLECQHRCSRVCGVPCTASCLQMVAKDLPCGHSTKLPCYLDALTYSCKEPCRAILSGCEHECQGNCGMCKNGREHIPCLQKCGRTLPCGHACEAGCSAPCPPCRKKCQKRCFHCRCRLSCGEICVSCREPCPWQCEHHKCELLCYEICARPRCDLRCKSVLKCGHRCIGLCGEPCPTKCRVCHPKTFDIITQTTLEDSEESDLFVEMQDCGHLFEVTNLDHWMDSDNSQSANAAIIKLKECPQCKMPVWRSMRYGNVLKSKQEKLDGVKKKMLGYEKTKQGQLKLERHDYSGAYQDFRAALEQNPVLMDAHFGAGRASYSAERYIWAFVHLSFIVEKSSYAAEVSSFLKETDILDRIIKSGFSKARRYCSPPSDELAVKAMLQLASVLTAMKAFSSAEKLCDAVIKRQSDNSDALEIKKSANSRVIASVVQAMSQDVGEKGHWYQCPNGHYYTIGECGGAMEQSVCPDCKAVVGGGRHTLAEGNRHSNIDGSTRSAWPGA